MRNVLLLGMLGLGLGLRVSSAEACTYAQLPAALNGYPADAEADVPTDVVPVYNAEALLLRLDAALSVSHAFSLHTAAGEEVPFSAEQTHIYWIELSPAEPLQPQTEYVLEARVPEQARGTDAAGNQLPYPSLRFRTGSGPVSELPAVPRARLQHWEFKNVPATSCDLWNKGTCVAVPKGQFVQAQFSAPDGSPDPYIYLYDDAFLTNLRADSTDTPFRCVELRNRALNGTYGEASRYCDGDAAMFEIRQDASLECTAQGMVHDGALVTASKTARQLRPGAADDPLPTEVTGAGDSGGCALAGPAPKSYGFTWALGAIALGLARRRRARLSD
jgi:hypothetical protein